MKIGVYQFNPEFGEPEKNLERIESALKQSDADLMVLPELCATGYQFKSADEVQALCEPVPDGFTTQRLIKIAEQTGMHIVAGLGELAGEKYYNSAILVGPQGFIGLYRKTHLFGDEKKWFAPGNTGFKVWDIGPAKIGIMICFDWIFPESARTLALMGADIICHPANLVLPYCPEAMKTRSIENRIFTITANRIGTESRLPNQTLTYIGSSQATNTRGDLLFHMGSDEEGIRVAEIDPQQAQNKQITQRNHLWEDRRPEYYKSDNLK